MSDQDWSQILKGEIVRLPDSDLVTELSEKVETTKMEVVAVDLESKTITLREIKK